MKNIMESFNLSILANIHPEMAKKIIKDFKLPFSYIDISHFMAAMSDMPEIAQEYTAAYDVITSLATNFVKPLQLNVIECIHKTMNAMVFHILNSPGYDTFNGSLVTKSGIKVSNTSPAYDINNLFPVDNICVPTGDIYNSNNVGKQYISIDLKNAAFQALKTWDIMYGKQYGYIIGNDINTYEKFVEYIIFTSEFGKEYPKEILMETFNYICKCKALRQVIFGKTNPKRIMHIEKFIMQAVVRLIAEDERFGIMPVRLNNDEVVYEYNLKLDQSLFVPETLKSLEWAITSTENGDTTTKVVKIDFDFHKNLYILEEYLLYQSIQLITHSLNNIKGVKFFVKNNRSMYTHLPMAPEFKSLPSNVYLIARALYEGKQELAKKFENIPIMVDGVFHWLSDPGYKSNNWQLITSDQISKVMNDSKEECNE